MSIRLPRNLFPQIHEDPAVNPTSRRKVVLPRITRQIMESKGYVFGDKLRVPGGYAWEATDPTGRQLKVGLKTAVNRWLNTASTLVEMVDTVIIATFEWDENDEKPKAFELIEVPSSALLKMIGKVRKAAEKRDWDPYGHYYMPLDPVLVDNGQVGSAGGAVIAAGKAFFGPEPVTWVNDEWGSAAPPPPVAAPHAPPPAADLGTLIAQAKAELAGKLGVPPENIQLSVRF